MAPPRDPLLSHPPSSPTEMKPPLPRAAKPTPTTPPANTGGLPHNPLYQAQPTTGTWPSATAATPAPSPAAAAAAPPQQSPADAAAGGVSLGRYEDTPSNFSFIPLDQMDKLLAGGSNGDISSLMPFYRPAPGTLAAQPRRQAMESSEDTTTSSYAGRERRLSTSSVVQSGRRKLKPVGSREFPAEEHDRMSDSTAAGNKDTAGSPAVDSPINSQLAKLQLPAKAKRAAAATAAEATGSGKCMLWTHPANPTPTAPDPAAKKAGKKRGAGEDTKDGTRRRKLPELPQRSSIYRGVTRHRWTGRYEAHLWDSSCLRNNTTGRGRTKGRQVYLGGYQSEITAARAYDRAAIKYWGEGATLNHPYDDYLAELEVMKGMTNEEYVAHLRRLSSGFSRGASNYRGVTKHHQHGRWEARIGRVMGNKYLYLGTFNSEEEAAKAYDVAAIKYRGVTAVINYSLTNYDVEAIQAAPPSFPVPADGDAKPSAARAAAAAEGSGAGGKKGKAKAAGGSPDEVKPPLGFKVDDFLSADDLHWPGLEGEYSDEASAMMRHLTRDGPGLPELPWGDDDVVMPSADRLWPLGLGGGGSGDSGDDDAVGRAMPAPPKATRRSERAAARAQARVEPATTTTAHAFPTEENIWPFQTTPAGATDDPVSRLQSSAMQMCNALASCLQSSTSPFGNNSSTMVVPASAMAAPTGVAHEEERGGLWDGPDEVELHNLTRIDPVGSSSNLAQFYQTGE